MSATKILWGQIIIVFLIVLAGVWGATQWTAAALAYQPELGPPWFEAFGWRVYPPPAFFWWWFSFDAYAPRIFLTGAYIAASGGFASIAVAIGMSVWRARELKNAETYGSARWASEREVRAAGLLGPNGVVLGKFARDYLRHDGPEHVLCFAPTRSGKGVGLVVPSLLTWSGSCIVHDIKGENWTLTAGFRARHGRVLLFDPTNAASAAYNPLLEVRRGQWEVRDVQNVADVLVDPEGSLERRNHWEKTSHSLLVGAILHVLYAETDKTLAGVAGFLSDPARTIEQTLAAMMATPHLGEAGVHPVVASAARELLNKSDNERSGVLSTAMSFLGLYRDPVVAQVTRACQWRISDLVEGDRPVTLYLVVPPSDISRTKPLIRLILNQIGRRLTEELTPKGNRHRVLLMLDEFPALGRLDFFESALAFMAGYGLKAFLIAQSLNQIEKAYGPNNAILVINTDRRTYHLELRATPATYMASVSWAYPQDQLIALQGRNAAAATAMPAATGVDVAALNFRYRIEGDRVPWTPARAFDDGRQVFIEFPAGISQGEMPPLFVTGARGDAELVNYRVHGRYMVVDRLFAAAELRLGDRRTEQRVRIVRDDGRRARP